MHLYWQDETTDSEGIRSRVLFSFGAVAGSVLQFPDNAPTTYASAHGNRIGAFESWEAATAAVEKAVSKPG